MELQNFTWHSCQLSSSLRCSTYSLLWTQFNNAKKCWNKSDVSIKYKKSGAFRYQLIHSSIFHSQVVVCWRRRVQYFKTGHMRALWVFPAEISYDFNANSTFQDQSRSKCYRDAVFRWAISVSRVRVDFLSRVFQHSVIKIHLKFALRALKSKEINLASNIRYLVSI